LSFIPFNRPYATGHEFGYIREAIDNLHLSGNGPFAQRCQQWLAHHTGAAAVFLTPSGSAALEMAVLLAGIGPGDEVIMPSFTFVSTANAVALRGGVPVFVDIRRDTLNMDEEAAAAAVTDRTRAILPVHYAGCGSDMEAICSLAARHGLLVIEDAAHGVMATQGGRALGGIGELGCVSFHETKNVTCGEGGALLVNDPSLVERAEVVAEKGTDRGAFFRGDVDRYSWVDLGSSYLASEISAAFLWAQLERAAEITRERMHVWSAYDERFEPLEAAGVLRRPVVPDGCEHNAHIYHLLLPDQATRDGLISQLRERDIQAVFHYVPLHSSPAGLRHARPAGPLEVTDWASERLVRLPLWMGMADEEVERVCAAVEQALG
jgi:dTDP-4-amino-4,6-dideoxygalactose transaminase